MVESAVDIIRKMIANLDYDTARINAHTAESFDSIQKNREALFQISVQRAEFVAFIEGK